MSDEVAYLKITELSQLYASRELSPLAAIKSCLDRIHQLDPKLNAFRLVTDDRALAAARASEERLLSGQSLGPLDGIPYATKDLFDVAGLPTTAGSKTLEDNIAASDATSIRKLAQAGMVLLGKTNTVEFAFGSAGINHSHGTPHNPWSGEHYVPGGSSSGSAVAVAAGLTPFATGSDTACSVRTPAALCGVVGLKTTVGRVSRSGVFSLSSTLDSVGPLTRSVTDAALILGVLQGKDSKDRSTLSVENIEVLAGIDDGIDQLRIALPLESDLFTELDPEVESAVRAAVQVIEGLGAHVDVMGFPEADTALAVRTSLSSVEGASFNAERLDKQYDLIDPAVGKRMMLGRQIAAVDYAAALREMYRLRTSMMETLRNVDVLLVPTTMVPSLPLATVDQDMDSYLRYARSYMRNCFVGNFLDLCAVSVPCGFTKGGMPIGLMVYAKPFREDLALRVARAYEKATDWLGNHPNLSWAGF